MSLQPPSEASITAAIKEDLPVAKGPNKLSNFEKLLETNYPICSAIFAHLTVLDIARLGSTSRTLRRVVGCIPILEATFFEPVDDPILAGRIQLWGPDHAKRIFLEEERSEARRRLYDPLDKISRIGNEAVKILLFRKEPKPNIQMQYVQKLCLDGTSITTDALVEIITAKSLTNLSELSIVSCARVSISNMELRTLLFKSKEGASGVALHHSIRKINFWDSLDIRNLAAKILAGTVQLENLISIEECTGIVLCIDLLHEYYSSDVAFCELHAKFQDIGIHRKSKDMPCHIVERTCNKCGTSSIWKLCSICVLNSSCEACNSFYCLDCIPWIHLDRNIYTDVRKDKVYRVEDFEGEHKTMKASCSFTHSRGHGYHRYHSTCASKIPYSPWCRGCYTNICRWKKGHTDCLECSIGWCDSCIDGDNSEVVSCAECKVPVCKDHEYHLEVGSACCGEYCDFWICEECTREMDFDKYERIYNDEAEKCARCLED